MPTIRIEERRRPRAHRRRTRPCSPSTCTGRPTCSSSRRGRTSARSARVGGELVSLFRPHDHVWHKGIAWSLPVVGDENFWGGPTFVSGQGYVQLPNNGSQRAPGVRRAADAAMPTARPHRRIASTGSPRPARPCSTSGARSRATVLDDDAWLLGFETRDAQRVGPRPSRSARPTTRGRENAGYGGLFWRGPRSFTGGTVLAPGVAGGDELRGIRAPWMGFSGRHDGSGGASTVVMVDDPGNVQHPPQWFARTEEFACLCPAPFFSEEHEVAARRHARAAVRRGDRRRRGRSRTRGRARRHGRRTPCPSSWVRDERGHPARVPRRHVGQRARGVRRPGARRARGRHPAPAHRLGRGLPRGRRAADGCRRSTARASRSIRSSAGALVWFEPGVIHRVVNDGGDLEVRVIMQNAGLPEAGDAVMTFPDDVLADPERYRAARDAARSPSIPMPNDSPRPSPAATSRCEGFLALFDDDGTVDPARLARLHERAVALVAPRAPEWRSRWEAGALAVARDTGDRLDALEAGRDPGLAAARVAASPAADAFGMCGRLRRYPTDPHRRRPMPEHAPAARRDHRHRRHRERARRRRSPPRPTPSSSPSSTATPSSPVRSPSAGAARDLRLARRPARERHRRRAARLHPARRARRAGHRRPRRRRCTWSARSRRRSRSTSSTR